MPKKKLTKTQVKNMFKRMGKITYDLALDKMGHPDSFSPMSKNKAMSILDDINRAK